jgi:hypothetical protein
MPAGVNLTGGSATTGTRTVTPANAGVQTGRGTRPEACGCLLAQA